MGEWADWSRLRNTTEKLSAELRRVVF